MKIQRMDNLEPRYVWCGAKGLETRMLGEAAGSERLYVNVDTVPPGAFSTKYHSHSRQEEFFLILSGSGTVRMNDGEYAVSSGDCIAKPAGRGIAHQFYNDGNVPLVILDAGTVECGDTVNYPDEGVQLEKWGEARRIYGADDGWSSDPNEG